jgi:RNA-dependent RNA polymerase
LTLFGYVQEIQEFFVKYMVNDSLGVISNAHVVHADSQPAMARSIECQELAKLVSIAVDFPKTGVPAIIPHNLRPRKYPDFMGKPDKDTYRSERVLGKLFRQVRGAYLEKSPSEVPREDIEQAFDANMIVPGYEEFTDLAKYQKNTYDRKLIGLMNQYGIETEAEAVSGNILNLARQHMKRRGDVVERIRDAVTSLIDEARQWFDRNADDLVDDDIYAKASAWYHVTYHPDHIKVSTIGKREVHLLSFPWVVYDVLLQIKKASGPSC